MSPEAWQKVSSALDLLLEQPETERHVLLDQLRKDDPEVCREVESLLSEQRHSSVLEAPPESLLAEATPTLLRGRDDAIFSAESIEKAGKYVVREEIARGGMGAVLRVFDPDFGRVLAVKVLLREVLCDPDAESRFLREAGITGRLQHPGIPPIHEIGRLDDGRPFFAMKLIEGQTLARLIADSRTSSPDAHFVSIFEQICRTLAYAHNQGIIHRDLKPSNIMVGAFGEVQVMDWGLAKSLKANADAGNDSAMTLTAADDSMTLAGAVSGTPAYIAPEQARGETDRLDERTDVFGLGGILYAMLMGRPPFEGSAQDALARSARGELDEAFARLEASSADPGLVEIAKKCLAAAQADRYRNAGETADAVTKHRESVQERLRQAELAREKAQVQVREERRRRRLAWTLAASVVTILIGSTVALIWYWQLQSAKTLRADNLNDQIRQSLDDAERERQRLNDRLQDRAEVQQLLGDLSPWRDSLKAARVHWIQARKLADSDEDLVTTAIGHRLQTVATGLDRDDSLEQAARELDALRLEFFHLDAKGTSTVQLAGSKAKDIQVVRPDLQRIHERYSKVFRTHGYDIEEANLDALADRIRQSPARHVFAAALDHWAWTALTRDPPDATLVKHLLDIARRVDPDRWSDTFRDWGVWTDPKRLEERMGSIPIQHQSRQILSLAVSLKKKHGAASVDLIRSALTHYPGDFWLNFQLAGEVLASNLDESISAYRTALAVRKDDPVALNNLAFLLRVKGDLPAAVRHFEKALQRDEDFVNARCGLASCYYLMNQLDQSIAHYQKALALDRNHPGIHNDVAVSYFVKGDYDRAEEHYANALKVDPRYVLARHGHAVALRQQGKYAEAADEMRQAHTLEPTKNRAAFVAEYERILKLSQRESPTPVALSMLAKGLQGVLTSEHPLDLYAKTSSSYRASHCVALKGGQTYQIDLRADNFDTLLRIEDDRYNLLLFNDDTCYPEILHSRILFTAPRDGTFRLVVTSFKAGATGNYAVQVQKAAPVGEPVVIRDSLTAADKKVKSGGHFKVHEIDLTESIPCTIVLESKDFNTRLQLTDASLKNALGTNESMHWERLRHSRLDTTPVKTGSYRLLAISAEPGRFGAYTITIQRYERQK